MRSPALLLCMGLTLTLAIPHPHLSTTRLIPSSTPTISRGACNLSCTKGSYLFHNPNDKCECVLHATTPKACSQSPCTSGYHPVWRKDTSTCACLENGSGDEARCIAATECLVGSAPVWDEDSHTCRCEKSDPCEDILCIAEQHPVANAQTGKCNCEWIDGFGPSGVWHPTLTTASLHTSPATAQKAPGPTVSLGCENLKIYCFEGDHYMHLDPSTGKCKCGEVASSSKVEYFPLPTQSH
ncbi:hypothetical protein F5882DRAFT_444387 [Hyaloscypha sp. PMI_1271]|nr:hypothetical protein F5882DRAFT_444387 [Hyaloscypha sp. PMI_1271]